MSEQEPVRTAIAAQLASQVAARVRATSACPHPEAVGTRWCDLISEERQAELQGYLDRWAAETDHGERKGAFDWRLGEERRGPFDPVKLGEERRVRLSGADVAWLAEQSGRDWLGGVPNLHLEQADLYGAHLEGADLTRAHLEGADLRDAELEGASLYVAHLERASLCMARLERASLHAAHLEGADLRDAELEGASVVDAHLEGATLRDAHLERANLSNASMDKATRLNNAALDRASLDQLSFDGANLAVVKWEAVTMLGDEVLARAAKDGNGKRQDRQTRLNDYEAAVRACTQLAAVMRSQGMSEQADRFTYRAQKLQRDRYRIQRHFGQWLFSWMLFLMAGYGYRLGRIVVAYALIVGVFAAAFLASDVVSGQTSLTVPHAFDALQISLNAVHGRVFFAQFHLDTLQSWLATAESIVGIVIEGVFVAMLIQRFFGR